MTIVTAAHQSGGDATNSAEADRAVRDEADRRVVEAVRRGDHNAFRELVRLHGRWIRGVVFGVLGNSDRVDDVCQQVFTALWTRIGELRDVDRWRPWAYRLARNAALDAGRAAARQRTLHGKLAEQPVRDGSGSPAGNELVSRESHQAVLDAIGALHQRYREPFVLRHLEGWSYARIGELMNLPIETVETRLVRARRQLRAALKDRI